MICGIDLAGSESRPTGVCILNDTAEFHTVHTNSQILSLINQSPSVVAIDAPLSFYGTHFRDCDLELRNHYPVLPLTFRGMQSLARRGISLTSCIPYPVIEVYPYASKRILGITSYTDLNRYGISARPSSIHELDAAAAALTGKYFLQGKYKAYGTNDQIIVPL
jgi:predicted nuclease with RNAse H fold